MEAPVSIDGGRDSFQHGAGTNTDDTNSVVFVPDPYPVVDWHALAWPNWKV